MKLRPGYVEYENEPDKDVPTGTNGAYPGILRGHQYLEHILARRHHPLVAFCQDIL